MCKDIVNSNKLNSDISLDKIKHKVIFPYQLCDGKAFLIDENVMKHKFPMTYKYLESQRDELARRDKGKGKDYPVWYAYGRTQSLVMPSIKLFSLKSQISLCAVLLLMPRICYFTMEWLLWVKMKER